MTKKNIKATKKPAYIVNVDAIEHLDDIDTVFGLAKHNAGLPISDDELASICYSMIEQFGTKIFIVDCKCDTPWYKRFWNWVTKPFKKNK